jgi:N-dimethylarginine dimethylaminohydrolase
MKKKKVALLMCPPDQYAIKYVINPWMKLTRQSNPVKANHQWKKLYGILSELKCAIKLIKPAMGLPDMVFTANAGLPVGNKVFLSRFRHKEREKEARHFRQWFKSQGLKIIEMPSGIFFEGAGDALFAGSKLYAAYRFRSDIRAHTLIAEALGIQVLSLELAKKRFYHLDTCFAPLSSKTVLYYPPAFDRYGRKVIEENIHDPIAVSRKEADRFVCNSIVVGKDIVMHHRCPETASLLTDRGFRIHETNLSEFIKAGGSAKCLTLQL